MKNPAVELRKITKSNIWQVFALTISEEQRGFVASNEKSIAQVYVYPEMVPLAICDGDTPVGFLMYGVDSDEGDYFGEYWLVRFMTDKTQQKKGYGSAAIQLFLERIKAEGARRVYLSTEPENIVAIKFYERFGFKSTGKMLDDEQVMLLTF